MKIKMNTLQKAGLLFLGLTIITKSTPFWLMIGPLLITVVAIRLCQKQILPLVDAANKLCTALEQWRTRPTTAAKKSSEPQEQKSLSG